MDKLDEFRQKLSALLKEYSADISVDSMYDGLCGMTLDVDGKEWHTYRTFIDKDTVLEGSV